MTLSAALTQIKTWSLTGLTSNLGLYVDPPAEADLPALVVDLSVSVAFAEGVKAVEINATSGIATIFIAHRLLLTGIGLDMPADRMDDLVTFTDRYLAEVISDMTLNGELADPLTIVTMRPGLVRHGGEVYSGIEFTHLWRLAVT